MSKCIRTNKRSKDSSFQAWWRCCQQACSKFCSKLVLCFQNYWLVQVVEACLWESMMGRRTTISSQKSSSISYAAMMFSSLMTCSTCSSTASEAAKIRDPIIFKLTLSQAHSLLCLPDSWSPFEMIQTWENREEKAKEPTFTLSALWNEEQKKSSQERQRERKRENGMM